MFVNLLAAPFVFTGFKAFRAPLGEDGAERLPRGVRRVLGGGVCVRGWRDVLLFEKMLLETIRADSSLDSSENKQQSKAVRKRLISALNH